MVVGPYDATTTRTTRRSARRRPTRSSSPGRSTTPSGCRRCGSTAALLPARPHGRRHEPVAGRGDGRRQRRDRPRQRLQPLGGRRRRTYFIGRRRPRADVARRPARRPDAPQPRWARRAGDAHRRGVHLGARRRQYEQTLLDAPCCARRSTRAVDVRAAPEGGCCVIDVAVVGLGKMGLSHLSMIKAHPDVRRRRRLRLDRLPAGRAREVHRGADVHATTTRCSTRPSRRGDHRHADSPARADGPSGARARSARLLREAARASTRPRRAALTRLAAERGLVTQVGYHNRFVGAFREVKRLLEPGRIGTVNTASGRGVRTGRAEAAGRHLAQPAHRGRRLPLRLRGAPARTCSTGTSARRRRSAGSAADQHLLRGDRRRGGVSTLHYPDGHRAALASTGRTSRSAR